MFEGTHHHLTNQVRLNDRLGQHIRHQLAQVGQNEIGLVVGCRVQRRHGQATVVHLRVLKHDEKHVNEDVLEHSIESVVTVRQRVSNSLHGHATDVGVLISEK